MLHLIWLHWFSPYISNPGKWTRYFTQERRKYKKFHTLLDDVQRSQKMEVLKLLSLTDQVLDQATSKLAREIARPNVRDKGLATKKLVKKFSH